MNVIRTIGNIVPQMIIKNQMSFLDEKYNEITFFPYDEYLTMITSVSGKYTIHYLPNTLA